MTMLHGRTDPSPTASTRYPAGNLPGLEVAGCPPLIDDRRLREPAEWTLGKRLDQNGTQRPLVRLNHASYGLAPRVVTEAQAELRRRIELDSVRYFKHDLERYSDAARLALGSFLNAPPEDITLVPNGTTAVAAIVRAFESSLDTNDEILVTDHEYMATINEVDRLCRRTGAIRTKARIPFPGPTPDGIFESIIAAVSERTKLVIVSHLASASALAFPVERLAAELAARDIPLLVDGAHGPGQIDVDITNLGAPFYAASCHKWLGTPKGSGFIYVTPEWQDRIEPPALSCRVHNTRADRKSFLADFDYVGTGDTTANLVIPTAIAHLGAQHPEGWPGIQARNHELVLQGARRVAAQAGLDLPVATEHLDSMIGAMIALPIPGAREPGAVFDDALWDQLYERGVQAPVWELPGVHPRVMRISAHLSTQLEDFDFLAHTLADLLRS